MLYDSSASPAVKSLYRLIKAGDYGYPAGLALYELNSSLYLGQHRAGGELAFGHVLPGFRYGKLIQILLVGFLVVDAYLFYSGKYNQSIGIQILRQLLACKILIYNGGCAFQLTLIVAYYRDTASAYGDDYEAVVNQALSSSISTGIGEATTRLQPRPASSFIT